MNTCRCDMRTKLIGDGYYRCNPELYLEYAMETIADQEVTMNEAAKVIKELCNAFGVPYPEATLDKLEC